MSFFGFDATLPRDRSQPSGSRGIFDSHDPFAGLSVGDRDAGVALDFDQTYDGLGQQLDESGDTFNDDTFGGDEPVTRESVGKDFDFAGQTANVRGTLLEEQVLHHARNATGPSQPPQKSIRTGYEAYRQPEYIPKLEADASIWGEPAVRKAVDGVSAGLASTATTSKMLSLEEVEAQMRAQVRPTQPVLDVHSQTQGLKDMLGLGHAAIISSQPQPEQQRPPQILQRPQQDNEPQQPSVDISSRAPHNRRNQQAHQHHGQSRSFHGLPPQQMSFQQQPSHGMHGGTVSPVPPVQAPRGPAQQYNHNRGPSYNGPPVTTAQQMMSMAPAEREAFLAEEAKRAKRNHKIFLLSKNNGLMTPQDKNFITRIQLQQLLTATGGVYNDIGSDAQLAEDFYYQVYAQIRGPPRSGPGQPLNQFAQTYLFQTSSRYGYGRSRHHPRGGDNHVQRMEQQVARAVEAAKARPKNKQLAMEGSLGKIAFSNSKTPRPLLNIKRPDTIRPEHAPNPADRKTALRYIEALYTVLMKLEDHERKLPPPPNEESAPEVIEGHMRWRREMQRLNEQLWEASKVMEPIQSNPTAPHPFIQILSHGKGKKAIPRVFRHLDDQQRLTMLTLISIHLDVLDVVRDAYPPADNTSLPARVREEIEIFIHIALPPFFSYVDNAPLPIIIGLLGLVLDRVQVQVIVRTRVGLDFLTILISRAEFVKQVGGNGGPSQQQPNSEDTQQWSEMYHRLFDALEPLLPYLFPTDTPVVASEDRYVWQFLASMGVAASPDEQQRLVLGVKERVMETVLASKTLPAEMRERRLGDVNLFMRAIGLDVDLLG